MNRKRSLWLLAILPIVGLTWAMKSAASWRPELFGSQPNAEIAWFSQNGRSVVVETSNNDYGFWVWDVETHQLLWKSRTGYFLLAMSPDSNTIVLAHATYPGGTQNNNTIATYPGSTQLKFVDGVSFELHNERNGRLIRRFEKCHFANGEELLESTCSARGNEFILVTTMFVYRWNMTTGKLLTVHKWSSPRFHEADLTTADCIPGKEQIVAYEYNYDNCIVIFDARTGRQLRQFRHCLASTNPVQDNFLRVSPDEYSFYETSTYQSNGRIFRLSDGKLLWRYADWPTFSPDGKLAYIPSESGLDVLDAHTGQHLNHLPGPRKYGFSISPDGNYLYEPRDGRIYRWRAR